MWEDGDLDQLLLEEDALLADTNGGADADDEVDEAALFREQPQQPQPMPSAIEEPDDDPPQQGSLLEFSQQQRARARQSGSSSRGSQQEVPYGEVASDMEDEAVRRWVQAHPQYSHHEDPDPAADDASSVNGGDGQSAGGPEVRQASVPSLSNTNPEK